MGPQWAVPRRGLRLYAPSTSGGLDQMMLGFQWLAIGPERAFATPQFDSADRMELVTCAGLKKDDR